MRAGVWRAHKKWRKDGGRSAVNQTNCLLLMLAL
jgi:hypothetical protein